MSIWRRLLGSPSNQRKPRHGARRLTTERLEERAMFTATALDSVNFGRILTSGISDRPGATAAASMGSTGNSLVVFQGQDRGANGSFGTGTDIFLRQVGSTSAAADPIRVNTVLGGDQLRPSIATNRSGNGLIVWEGRGPGDFDGIFARRVGPDGALVGTQLLVNQETRGEQSHAAVAVATSGEAIVVWQGAGSGDAAGVFLRRVSATGQPTGDAILVNTTVAGEQAYPSIAMDGSGNFVVTWSSRGTGANGWDIFQQRFNAAGTRQGNETRVNTATAGAQMQSVLGRSEAGEYVVAWNSFGQDGDGWGVFAQRFDAQGTALGNEFRLHAATTGHQRDASVAVASAGEILASWSHAVPDGRGWEIQARVFDADGAAEGDAFAVNPSTRSAGDQRFPRAAIDNEGMAVIAFQGDHRTITQGITAQRYRVTVSPPVNVRPELADVANRTAAVGELVEVVVTATDANRRDTLTFTLDREQSPASATITRIDNTSARIRWTPAAADRNRNVSIRVLVDDNGTPQLGDALSFLVNVTNAAPVVDANGTAAGVNGTATLPMTATRVVLAPNLTVADADQPQVTSARAVIRGLLDGTAESLEVVTTDTNIQATYDAPTGTLTLTGADTPANYQKVLRTLAYENTSTPPTGSVRRVEITAFDGTANSVVAEVRVTLEGQNDPPTLATIANTNVLFGSPLHVPLNGTDANGDPLTYTVTSSNPSVVAASVLTGNRSLKLDVQNFGEMTFYLFEDKAPRATSQIIALANADFYDGIIFHRVIDGFMIQAGDPTGTGTSGSSRPDFDDQFDVDLQHNRSGVLSMAKSTDDTNNSQFFITETATRHLDFNHTIFGQLVEGDTVREAISNVAVTGSKPRTDVVIRSATVFDDTKNGMLFLKAGASSGTSTITVTVNDGRGGTASRSFTVTVQPDSGENSNGGPFLRDIPSVQTSVNTPTTYQLMARDAENDPFFFLDETALRQRNLFVPVASHPDLDYTVNPSTGLLAIEPKNGLTGTYRIVVAVASSLTGLTQNSHLDYQQVTVVIS